ncbi:MAG: DEAD/DEAH box helicase, partial [Chloroflexota bacterium]
KAGTQLLYISPLKALNNDVHRNLRTPLAGIRQVAKQQNLAFPDIRHAVRSGDTSSKERQAMVRKSPHILITTPESLYLMITSPKARDIFRTVKTVIVDEIHTLAGNKRGVHLSLSLERLAHLAENPVQRIGLSATIQPLDEVARFLGGQASEMAEGQEQSPTPELRKLEPRPVTVVNAHVPKALDMRVVSLVESFRDLPSDSIWPTMIPELLALIKQHKTTLIFCNSRRQAERTANRLNEQLAADNEGGESPFIADGVATGQGMMGSGQGEHPAVIRAHHGSMSREARLEMEHDLKEGRLMALVATSSLELGIDIGAIDLVIQLQSPKSVAQGLQRVGRSGHMVGQTSKGRLFPTHREDIVEAAAVTGGMLRGEVEPTYTPQNPLDVLAQQIVAMVSVAPWPVDDLLALVRQTYAYHNLSREAFRSVLEMLAGKYPSQMHQQLRARLAWDQVNNVVTALPGSQLLALTNGGTISDRGLFAAYQAQSRVKLGELDEEFIYESRIGDTFMLGSQVWRVTEITDDRILVQAAPGAVPRMPFWRGEYAWRAFSLGQRIGQFRREVADRICEISTDWADYRDIADHRDTAEVQSILTWLQANYALDSYASWQVIDYVIDHLASHDTISSDKTIVVEIFPDSIGVPQMVVHSPFGGRVNGPWGLALAGALREQLGVNIEVQSNDDGILLRLPDADYGFPPDLVAHLGPSEAREQLLRELPESAVFGAQFRQNAARSLLLPSNRTGKRTPFWLQRLKAKDLMQVVRQFSDFPIMIETYRDCLETVMDVPNLEVVLNGIEQGEIQVMVTEPITPSPLAVSLMRQFTEIYLYEWDTPKAERQLQQLALNRDLLQDVLKDVNLGELLQPEAIAAVTEKLQHTADFSQARTVDELAVLLEEMGDLSPAEIADRTTVVPEEWLQILSDQGRIHLLDIPTTNGLETRWVIHHQVETYHLAFSSGEAESHTDGDKVEAARQLILTQFLGRVGPITFDDIRVRYDFPSDWLQAELACQVEDGALTHGQFEPTTSAGGQYLARENLAQIHRRSLSLLRQAVAPVPRIVYAEFLAEWHGIDAPSGEIREARSIDDILQQLRGLPLPISIWEQDIFPVRFPAYRPTNLDTLFQQGELVWVGNGNNHLNHSRVRFVFRGEGYLYVPDAPDDLATLSENAQQLYTLLKEEGALFLSEIRRMQSFSEPQIQEALLELINQALITNDTFDALRQMMNVPVTRSASEKPRSTLEAQLAARRQGPTISTRIGKRPSRSAYQAAMRRVNTRLQRSAASSEPKASPTQGRWSLVHRTGVMGTQNVVRGAAGDGTATLENRVSRQSRLLLQRWGVVTRETLVQEHGPWHWRELYAQLSLMEMRGEVRRGHFVDGLPGLQFALPDVVERLRSLRDDVSDGPKPIIVLNACDPANLYGPSLADGPLTITGESLLFARRPSTWLVQQRGYPLVVLENKGERVVTMAGFSEAVVQQALDCWLDHMARIVNRVTIQTWNHTPILDSEGHQILERLGLRRQYPAMVWERPL